MTDLAVVRERLAAGKTFVYCRACDKKVTLIDQIEQRLATDKVARQVRDMDERAGVELDKQSLEQILIGHMMAIAGEANQIFRPVTMFDHGIDGEIEFRDRDGKASGRKVYVQLKSGDSHLRLRKRDDQLVFDIKHPRHIDYWQSQACDVWLVIRYQDVIRWMNVSDYLRRRPDQASRQIVFDGE